MDNDVNNIADYAAAGLDKYMRPLNAPITNQGSFVGGMDFNTNFDRNAVTAINLRNFNFNAGTGGTLVLGGANNGNGNFLLKNAAGSTIVTGDNTGITVTNGSINIYNAGGSLSINASGVLSQTNFFKENIFNGALGQTTTSTSSVDVSGATLNPLVLTNNSYVLFFMMAYGLNKLYLESVGSYSMEINLVDSYDSGTISNVICSGLAVSYTPDGFSFFENTFNQMNSRTTMDFLNAGTHTFKLQFRAITGGTALLNAFEFGYVVLGK